MWVTDSRMLCSLPRSSLVHPIDRFDSEGWFSSDCDTFKLCFVFFGEKHAAFKWKDAISGFPVSPGSAEALVRWGGKTKYIFDCLLSRQHLCQKLKQSNYVYVKIIASCKGGTFFETQCTLLPQNAPLFEHKNEWTCISKFRMPKNKLVHLRWCCSKKKTDSFLIKHNVYQFRNLSFFFCGQTQKVANYVYIKNWYPPLRAGGGPICPLAWDPGL